MFENAKILIPLDGSEQSARVLPYLRDLARVWKARLLLLRVVDPLSFASPAVDELEHWGQTARLEAKRFLSEQAGELQGVEVETLCHSGPAVQVICQVAENCDLIAFAPHGHGGVERWVFGSVAEEVIRDASCPVLLVRGETNVRFHHLLLPVDAGEASLEVCRRSQIFVPDGIRVTLLHFHHQQQMDERWCKTFEGLTEGKDSWNLVCRPGKPAGGVVEWSLRSDCDLIAMATRGRKGWERFWKGSVTEHVGRHAPCPVLIFPPASLTGDREECETAQPAEKLSS